MTKKHFTAFAIAIANDIANARINHPAQFAETVRAANYAAQTFAFVALSDNPRFDRDRFMAACGLRDAAVIATLKGGK